MTDPIVTQANTVYRDYLTDGVSISGANKPAKSDIRALWASLSVILDAFSGVTGSGYVGFSNVALLNSNLNFPANTVAEVFVDPTPSNNGLYLKSGASGIGSWTQVSTLTLPGLSAAISAEAARAGTSETAISNQLPTPAPSLGIFAGEPTIASIVDINQNVIAISTPSMDLRRGVSGLQPVGRSLLEMNTNVSSPNPGYALLDASVVAIVMFMGQSNAEGDGDILDPACAVVATTPIYPQNALMLGPTVRVATRYSGGDLAPPMTQIGTSLVSLAETADTVLQAFETAASGCINQLINRGYQAALKQVAKISANSAWSTASTVISMILPNPQSVSAGMSVLDLTTGNTIGTVASYNGTTLTLTAPAAFASSGASDALAFISGQLMTAAAMVVAHGSYSIAQLKRGTPVYNFALRGLRDLCGKIWERGQRPVVACIDFNQHETDVSIGTDPQQYARSLLVLVRNLNEDFKSITGQSTEIIMTVTAAQYPANAVGFQNIVLAHQIAAVTDSRIILSQPTYQYKRVNNTNLSASAAFTTSSTTIPMTPINPGWVIAGALVYNLSTASMVGTVASYIGATLTLKAPSLSNSGGAADVLIFAGANTIHYTSGGHDTYGITLGDIIFEEVCGPGYVAMRPTEVYFSTPTQIVIRWPYPPFIDLSNQMVTTAGLPAGGTYGLYFNDNSASPPVITNVTNSGIATFITLSAASTGTKPVLEYATRCNAGLQQGNYNDLGPITGARGFIRAAGSGSTNFYESYFPAYKWAHPFIWKL